MPTAMPVEPLVVEDFNKSFTTKVVSQRAASPSTPLHAIVVPSVSLTSGVDAIALETASKILDIIDRYRLRRSSDATTKADEGALKFLALIYSHVKAGVEVPMCLPAFPFKSPNSVSKVLGKLPDRAEELALSHLNGICAAIKDIYPPGAMLTIISDGLVYNGMSIFTMRKTISLLTDSNLSMNRLARCPRQGCMELWRNSPSLGQVQGLDQHHLLPASRPCYYSSTR